MLVKKIIWLYKILEVKISKCLSHLNQGSKYESHKVLYWGKKKDNKYHVKREYLLWTAEYINQLKKMK